jgi:hypothetical protein
VSDLQDYVDAYADKHGPCCAGCDFWRWINTGVGECIRHAPDPSHDAAGGLGVNACSLPPSSTMLTRRDHWCGDFEDTPRP